MSIHAPGTFQFAERIMDSNVTEAHRWAKAEQLRCQARGGRESCHRFYFGALVWLGQQLAGLGQRLVERYSTASTASVPQSANSLVQ